MQPHAEVVIIEIDVVSTLLDTALGHLTRPVREILTEGSGSKAPLESLKNAAFQEVVPVINFAHGIEFHHVSVS